MVGLLVEVEAGQVGGWRPQEGIQANQGRQGQCGQAQDCKAQANETRTREEAQVAIVGGVCLVNVSVFVWASVCRVGGVDMAG